MGRDPSPGLMAEYIMVTILMIRKKGMESTSGLMEESTAAHGRMVSSMERDTTHLLKELRGEECGKMERD